MNVGIWKEEIPCPLRKVEASWAKNPQVSSKSTPAPSFPRGPVQERRCSDTVNKPVPAGSKKSPRAHPARTAPGEASCGAEPT